MNTIKYSFVIPAYNAEKYIIECLSSINAQNYDNYEVFIIDDGSSDNTIQVIKEYIEDKDRFKLILNEHGGVCKARNTGISLATGDYICFVDADDCVSSEYLSEVTKQAADGYDVIYFQYQLGTDIVEDRNKDTGIRILNRDDIEYLSAGALYHTPEVDQIDGKYYGINSFSSWMQIYRTAIFKENDLRYTENILLSEDGLLNLELLYYCRKGCIINKALYGYRIDNISATRSYKRELLSSFLIRDEKIKEIINRLYVEHSESYWNAFYSSMFYQLRIMCENSVFHDKNPESIDDKTARFYELLSLPDYAEAISRGDSLYLTEEDRKYLDYAKTGDVKALIRDMKKQGRNRKMHAMARKVLVALKMR